jgi:hypothetical protein
MLAACQSVPEARQKSRMRSGIVRAAAIDSGAVRLVTVFASAGRRARS